MTDKIEGYGKGHVLPSLVKQMSIERMAAEVWAMGNPIHFDQQFAESQGLPAPMATGEMSSAYVSELLTNCFGEAWVRGGRISLKYVVPVYAGDTITVYARIEERTESANGVSLNLGIWCENQRHERVTVGTAVARL